MLSVTVSVDPAMLALATMTLPAKSIMLPTARPDILPAKAAGLSSLSTPLPSTKETVWVESTKPVNSSAARSPIENVPVVDGAAAATAPPIKAKPLARIFTVPELLNARAAPIAPLAKKPLLPLTLITPKLLIALVALPNPFEPLTFHVAPAALLKIELPTRTDDHSATLPVIVPPPLLLMVTPPELVVIKLLPTLIATLTPLNNMFAVTLTVPELAKVAALALKLLIWTVALF